MKRLLLASFLIITIFLAPSFVFAQRDYSRESRYERSYSKTTCYCCERSERKEKSRTYQSKSRYESSRYESRYRVTSNDYDRYDRRERTRDGNFYDFYNGSSYNGSYELVPFR